MYIVLDEIGIICISMSIYLLIDKERISQACTSRIPTSVLGHPSSIPKWVQLGPIWNADWVTCQKFMNLIEKKLFENNR